MNFLSIATIGNSIGLIAVAVALMLNAKNLNEVRAQNERIANMQIINYAPQDVRPLIAETYSEGTFKFNCENYRYIQVGKLIHYRNVSTNGPVVKIWARDFKKEFKGVKL